MKNRKRRFARWLFPALVLFFVVFPTFPAFDQQIPALRFSVGVDRAESPRDVSLSLQILLLLTILSLGPSILVMVTSFTRIIIVLGFLRQALATQQMPPNQVLIGLSLFLTFYVMAPVWNEVNSQAIQPYLNEQITQREAFDRAVVPVREFMFRQAREKDLQLFTDLAHLERPSDRSQVPTYVLIPAFVISELKTAFQIGFIIFVPFLIIDMVVASVLMSMGMLMLPPILISLPFKVIMFVLADGWNLMIGSLVRSFR